MRRPFWLLLGCALAAACGSDEGFTPTAAFTAPDAGASGPKPTPDAPPAAPAPKRTVTTKNPFGNVAAKSNLLWDGDFEWSTMFAQQAGWVNAGTLVTFSAFTQVRPDSACRSGIKCGYLTQSQRIAAIGVSPGKDKKVQASLWVKVPGKQCAEVSAALIACDYQTDPDVPLADEDGLPDASGWCRLAAVSAPRARATCLYVEALFEEGEALIDDAVVEAAPDSAVPTSAATERDRYHEARKAIRGRLRPAPREPTAAELAFEAWSRRPR